MLKILFQKRWKTGSSSSKRWIERQKNDVHTRESKNQHYRSRASFKLIEINQKYKVFQKQTKNIVDLGFAPGSWSQVALNLSKNRQTSPLILGVDLIKCHPPEGCHFIQGDILTKATHDDISGFFNERSVCKSDKPVDLVISDMMVNTSGVKDSDHFASMDLCEGTLLLADNLLKDNGNIVMKYYAGKEEDSLTERMESRFHKVFKMKPKSSRGGSREMYILGLNKKTVL